MKGSAAGPQQEERKMKLTVLFNAYGMTNHALDAAAKEILRDIAWCEQHRREDYAVLTKIRRNVGQRRKTRMNL
jgi:hypothetical protein